MGFCIIEFLKIYVDIEHFQKFMEIYDRLKYLNECFNKLSSTINVLIDPSQLK